MVIPERTWGRGLSGPAPRPCEWGQSGGAPVAEQLDLQARAVSPGPAQALVHDPGAGGQGLGADALGHQENVLVPPAAERGQESFDLGEVGHLANDKLELALRVRV